MQAIENGPAFPIATRRDAIGQAEERAILAEHRIDLLGGPNIEAPLFAFAVGVDGRGKAAIGQHLALEPAYGLLHALKE